MWLKFFRSLIFFPFFSFFLAEALYPLSSKAKLETHETIFVTYPGQRYNWKWEEFLAPFSSPLFGFQMCGIEAGGGFTCGYPPGRGVLIRTKENWSLVWKWLTVEWVAGNKRKALLLVFLTYSYIFCSSSASVSLIQICFPLKSTLSASIECLLCAVGIVSKGEI